MNSRNGAILFDLVVIMLDGYISNRHNNCRSVFCPRLIREILSIRSIVTLLIVYNFQLIYWTLNDNITIDKPGN